MKTCGELLFLGGYRLRKEWEKEVGVLESADFHSLWCPFWLSLGHSGEA